MLYSHLVLFCLLPATVAIQLHLQRLLALSLLLPLLSALLSALQNCNVCCIQYCFTNYCGIYAYLQPRNFVIFVKQYLIVISKSCFGNGHGAPAMTIDQDNEDIVNDQSSNFQWARSGNFWKKQDNCGSKTLLDLHVRDA